MTGLMHETNEVNDVTIDLIADIVGKRAAVFAGEAVWGHMIAPFPSNDRSDSILDPFVKVSAEPVRNREIPGLCVQQVLLEKRREDRFHNVSSNT